MESGGAKHGTAWQAALGLMTIRFVFLMGDRGKLVPRFYWLNTRKCDRKDILDPTVFVSVGDPVFTCIPHIGLTFCNDNVRFIGVVLKSV